MKNIYSEFPTTNSLKDFLNIIGQEEGISFTNPNQKVNLGQVISIFCDHTHLLTAPDCKKLFTYI